MATYSGDIRRGLPREPGGEPWPTGGVAAMPEVLSSSPASSDAPPPPRIDEDEGAVNVGVREHVPGTDEMVEKPAEEATPARTTPETSQTPELRPVEVAAAGVGSQLRRGLPRVPGGEPWPSEGVAPNSVAPVATPAVTPAAGEPATGAPSGTASVGQPIDNASSGSAEADRPAPSGDGAPAAPTQTASAAASVASGANAPAASETPLRRGLPRVAGGEPWPPAGFAPALSPAVSAAVSAAPTIPAQTSETTDATASAVEATPAAEAAQAAGAAPDAEGVRADAAPGGAQARGSSERVHGVSSTESAATATTSTPKPKQKPKREPIMIRGKALAHWSRLGILGALGAVATAGILVLAARGVTTLPGVPEWLERYPGEYALPATAEPGFPWWARWSHFFNLFLMVLIIRSGLLVRHQQKAPAFFTPRRGGTKISINLWLHTSLDVLWVANGLVFVILLFASGHWMRIVPTSWEVFPNALSAGLQYLTLDWPTEHGWVNYNSLQQLMYFIVIFIAAPLAIITGVRMSDWWPKRAERLNRMYPAPLARALHYPTMLFFVLFILAHVFLVLTTGALRNLNHMFAGTDLVNWTGFWLFALAIFVTAAAWVAARPLVLAPIASLFGKVSNR